MEYSEHHNRNLQEHGDVMNDETPTPRTDSEAMYEQDGKRKYDNKVSSDFARQLERELNEAEIQLIGWKYAASLLRTGIGLPDGTDLREVLLKFKELKNEPNYTLNASQAP